MAARSTPIARPGSPRGRSRARGGGRTLALGGPSAARVRWDRVGQMALACVLVALVYLYLSAGLQMLSTWRQSRHDKAVVSVLEHEHSQLAAQHRELSGQAALEAQARQLGMMRAGEQPYLVSGLPDN